MTQHCMRVCQWRAAYRDEERVAGPQLRLVPPAARGVRALVVVQPRGGRPAAGGAGGGCTGRGVAVAEAGLEEGRLDGRAEDHVLATDHLGREGERDSVSMERGMSSHGEGGKRRDVPGRVGCRVHRSAAATACPPAPATRAAPPPRCRRAPTDSQRSTAVGRAAGRRVLQGRCYAGAR
jgi:hypothetical protein